MSCGRHNSAVSLTAGSELTPSYGDSRAEDLPKATNFQCLMAASMRPTPARLCCFRQQLWKLLAVRS